MFRCRVKSFRISTARTPQTRRSAVLTGSVSVVSWHSPSKWKGWGFDSLVASLFSFHHSLYSSIFFKNDSRQSRTLTKDIFRALISDWHVWKPMENWYLWWYSLDCQNRCNHEVWCSVFARLHHACMRAPLLSLHFFSLCVNAVFFYIPTWITFWQNYTLACSLQNLEAIGCFGAE